MINSGRIQYFVQYGSGPYLKPVHIGSLSPIFVIADRSLACIGDASGGSDAACNVGWSLSAEDNEVVYTEQT